MNANMSRKSTHRESGALTLRAQCKNVREHPAQECFTAQPFCLSVRPSVRLCICLSLSLFLVSFFSRTCQT